MAKGTATAADVVETRIGRLEGSLKSIDEKLQRAPTSSDMEAMRENLGVVGQRNQALANRFAFLSGGVAVAAALLIGSGFVVTSIIENLRAEVRSIQTTEAELKQRLETLQRQADELQRQGDEQNQRQARRVAELQGKADALKGELDDHAKRAVTSAAQARLSGITTNIVDLKTSVNALILKLKQLEPPVNVGGDISDGNHTKNNPQIWDCPQGALFAGLLTYVEDNHIKVGFRCKSLPSPQIP
jgi:DNA repair exonuclease SbcCD ATPase subunit